MTTPPRRRCTSYPSGLVEDQQPRSTNMTDISGTDPTALIGMKSTNTGTQAR